MLLVCVKYVFVCFCVSGVCSGYVSLVYFVCFFGMFVVTLGMYLGIFLVCFWCVLTIFGISFGYVFVYCMCLLGFGHVSGMLFFV